jgi:large subunit ribosomal protein L4
MELAIIGGKKPLEVSDAVFDREFREDLVHQVVNAYMAGARAGTKAQKTRSEVSGGGKKPWKQKGTGNARAGTSRGPIWRGGGVTFAARPRNFEQKVNRKMYRGAIQSILSELNRQGRLQVVDSIDVAEPKTRLLVEKLKGLASGRRTLIVTESGSEALYLSARNLFNVGVVDVAAMDPVTLVAADQVVMTVESVKKIEEWLA